MKNAISLVLLMLVLTAGIPAAGASTQEGETDDVQITLLSPPPQPSKEGGFGYLGFELTAPWMDGKLIMRMPETLQSSRGLHFIDHYRADMPQLSPIDPPAWHRDAESGAYHYEVATADGLEFSGRAHPVADGVEMVFRVRNASDARIENIMNQQCLVMSQSRDFGRQRDLHPEYTWWDGRFQSLADTTPTPEEKNRAPWILMRTRALGDRYSGPMEWADGWWVVHELADYNLIARASEDASHLVAIAWDDEAAMLMTNTNIPCLHAGPTRSYSLDPGEEGVWRGKIYLTENDPEALLAAWRRDVAAGFNSAAVKPARGVELYPLAVDTPVKRATGMPEGKDLSRIAFEARVPWMQGTVELRMPEVLRSSMGFHFLDHYLSTIEPLTELDPFPQWRRDPATGALEYTYTTTNGLTFGGKAEPGTDEITLTFHVENRTGRDLQGVDANMCLDLGGSDTFNQRNTLAPLYAVFDGAYQTLAHTTPTPETVGRDPWLILLTQRGKDIFDGPKDTRTTWWRTDQVVDANLMAAESADGKHLIGYTWDVTPINLMTNCGNPCLHTGPGVIDSLPNGAAFTWHGKIYFLENDPDALLARFRRDHAAWKAGRDAQ